MAQLIAPSHYLPSLPFKIKSGDGAINCAISTTYPASPLKSKVEMAQLIPPSHYLPSLPFKIKEFSDGGINSAI
jgi:hypothetical protein